MPQEKKTKSYLEIIKELDGKKQKGKFRPLSTKTQVIQIKKVYTFQSLKPNYPFILFLGKEFQLLGITLSRQSSDLLSRLAKDIITLKKHELSIKSLNLIQYKLPGNLSNFNLILTIKWEKMNDFEKLTSILQSLQTHFLQKLENLSQKLIDLLD